MLKPFKVEISRLVEKVQWANILVYARSPEEAAKLAKPLCDEANDNAEYDCPFDFDVNDEGSFELWSVQDAGDIEQTDDFCPDADAINEPDEDEEVPDDTPSIDTSFHDHEMDV